MTQDEFAYLCKFLKEQSGLVLSADKTYLAESRLTPVARKYGLHGLGDLVASVRARRDPALNVEVVEAMTTNESFFFRDIKPFDALRDSVMPRLVEARKAAGATKLRIWSAACSSGQEPYSIAMTIRENPGLTAGLGVEILGTDLSSEILTKAKSGVYTQFEAQRGLPIRLLMTYFDQVGEHWQINQEIRSMVTFHPANLLHDLSRFGTFDIVFCRNVLIYFDVATKTDVLQRIRAQMHPEGMLILGGAETVIGISDEFVTLPGERGVYTTANPDARSVSAKSTFAKSA